MTGRRKFDPGAYLLYNPETSQLYVGSGSNPEERKQSHLTNLRGNKHVNKKLQEAFNRNPNFEFSSISLESRATAFDFEQAVIDEFWGNPLLLNLSRDARHCSVSHSDETKEKISLANTGLVRSAETREKIRQAKLGVPRPESVREAVRNARLGSTASAETRARSSESHKGVKMPPRTPEHMAKIVEAKKGFTHSEESINKLRASAPNSRSVSIDGQSYRSISEAERQLGLSRRVIRDRLAAFDQSSE